MKNEIKPGDRVTLSHLCGLGRGVFQVLEVDPHDIINRLHVQGTNGNTWWTRIEGAKIVPHWI